MATFHTKYDDWMDRLAACVQERVGSTPAWGTNDCMTWASDCIEAQTGHDYWAAYRGSYDSARGAARALRRIDKVKLPIELMDRLWGPRVHISQAKHGDLVVIAAGEPFDMGPSVGLCYGARSLFVGTDEHGDGLARVDTLTLEHCYQPWASSAKH